MTNFPAPAQNGFLLPPGTTAARLPRLLTADIRLQLDSTDKFQQAYLDSFDWRLYRAGELFEYRQLRDKRMLFLRALADGAIRHQIDSDSRPDWPAAIPAGSMRKRLCKLLEMRVLLPLVEIETRVHRFRVLNEDEKTIAWLQLELPQCHAPGRREARSLLPRIFLYPVRGYTDETAAVAGQLGEELELPAAPKVLYEEALTAIGRETGDYSSKIDVELTPDMLALDAARRIFLQLLDTIEHNVDGTRRDLDSEFLHDLRVATRRTRSALTQIKGILPAQHLEDFKARFAWLGQVTGPTRDLDVFLLTFPDYQAKVPEVQRPALEPLREFLEAHQRTEQSALRRKLSSPHFRKLLTDWRDFLNGLQASDAEAQPNAALPVKQVADARIWRMFRRVLREGRAINTDSPPSDLHELRKSCKKLRYLIEFFQSLYGSDSKSLVQALKRLLDNLGEYQDLEVQADKLTHFAEQMKQESDVPLPTLLAIGGLVSDLLRRQAEAREVFSARFAEFDSKRNRASYKALFRPSESRA